MSYKGFSYLFFLSRLVEIQYLKLGARNALMHVPSSLTVSLMAEVNFDLPSASVSTPIRTFVFFASLTHLIQNIKIVRFNLAL